MLAAAGAWIFLTWIAVVAILVGIGSIGLKWLGPDNRIGDKFWLRLCCTIALLRVWSALSRALGDQAVEPFAKRSACGTANVIRIDRVYADCRRQVLGGSFALYSLF